MQFLPAVAAAATSHSRKFIVNFLQFNDQNMEFSMHFCISIALRHLSISITFTSDIHQWTANSSSIWTSVLLSQLFSSSSFTSHWEQWNELLNRNYQSTAIPSESLWTLIVFQFFKNNCNYLDWRTPIKPTQAGYTQLNAVAE